MLGIRLLKHASTAWHAPQPKVSRGGAGAHLEQLLDVGVVHVGADVLHHQRARLALGGRRGLQRVRRAQRAPAAHLGQPVQPCDYHNTPHCISMPITSLTPSMRRSKHDVIGQ